MFKVLIDTCAFQEYKLDTSSPVFDELTSLQSQGKVKLYTSPVVYAEIVEHLEEIGAKSFNRLKSAFDKCEIVFLSDLCEIFPDLKRDLEILKKDFVEKRKEKFDDFFSDMDAEEIKVSGVTVAGLLTDYFGKKPPFGEGKKKSEFPDAIILKSLVEELHDCLGQLCVVSNDSGWKQFFAPYDEVKVFSKISEFTNFVNHDFNAALAEQLHRAMQSKISFIKQEIENQFGHQEFDTNNDAWWDPEVVNSDNLQVNIGDIKLVSVKDSSAEWEVPVDVSYTIDISMGDQDTIHRDSDTRELLCAGRNTYRFYIKKSIDLYCESSFDTDNIRASFELDHFDVEELFDFEEHILKIETIEGWNDDWSDE